jgi:hypothetical protein
MAKKNSTVHDNNKYHSSDNVKETFKASERSKDEVYPSVSSDMVTLVFKKNRTKELHVNKKIYRFEGPQAKEVPRSVIEHPDFENQRKYFLIKGE